MKPWTFRFRSSFSLRTFICAVTLLSIVIGVYANWTRRRQAALATLAAAKVYPQTAYEYRKFKSILFIPGYVPPPINRTWSERILGDGVHQISIMQQKVPGDLVRSVAVFPELRMLSFYESDVGDKELQVLRRLRQLEYLNLTSCAISDASAEVIGGFRELKWLELNETNLTDAAIPHLMRLEKLEVLRFRHTNFTEQGILQLASLPNLKEIHYRQKPGAARPLGDLYPSLKQQFPDLNIANW